jgi:hypothetical protein
LYSVADGASEFIDGFAVAARLRAEASMIELDGHQQITTVRFSCRRTCRSASDLESA